jgi:hypothetical protein
MKPLLTVLFLLLVSTAAFADTKTHKASQISFWVPDSWTVEGEDKDQLQASDPKGEVALLFLVRDAKDMKAALAAIDKIIATLATDVKIGSAKKIELNGMEGSVVDATGKASGKAVELSVLIIKTPTGKYLTVLGVVEADKRKRHEPDLRKILASLAPMKKFGK